MPSTPTDVLTSLQTNVDSIWVFYGWDGIAAEVKGIDMDYWAFSDIEPTFDYYTPVILANNAFLQEDPETAKAFLAATRKGYEYAIANPREAADFLLAASPELDKDLVYASQEYLLRPVSGGRGSLGGSSTPPAGTASISGCGTTSCWRRKSPPELGTPTTTFPSSP